MPEPRRRAVPRGAAVTFIILGAIAAACGDAADASGSASPSRAGGTRATPLPAGTEAETAAPEERLVVDADLLEILPRSVAGVPMLPATDNATALATSEELATTASAIAVGVFAEANAAGRDDFASSTVVQLRPGVFSDDFYTDWRASYDRAACEPAGGVASHVQQRIGSHTVEVNVCREGARTYHTHLPGDRLVSITAVGDRKFGDLVMAGLRQ